MNLTEDLRTQFELATDWDEVFEYLPGIVVELRSQPGIRHRIASYDITMVPPIWLKNDPHPRYPHELRIISQIGALACPQELPLPEKLVLT
ncbi:hypothetical protein Pse7367_3251 [Thalassoporum mexicanum PCC 7367]|uniref:hypothetical protein n=1 Tax=Thalassoporum mexicanum TaxID=3457544 RepID=UPI00029FD8CD|nr:hypothetical protein [Pseudanabaena sp. PCC 7367]AFY71494.1 hypothetical protein Pse7367_3251 [Pseudanabaena sp. PCC 7367]